MEESDLEIHAGVYLAGTQWAGLACSLRKGAWLWLWLWLWPWPCTRATAAPSFMVAQNQRVGEGSGDPEAPHSGVLFAKNSQWNGNVLMI